MARRRDYAAEYERRNLRARMLGFRGEAARRMAPRHLRSAKDFRLLPEAARESRSRVLSVVHRSRGDRTSVEEQAAAAGIEMWEVRYWAAEALERTRRGRTLPTVGDRLLRLRPLVVEGADELEFVLVRGSRAADEADRIFGVQWRFITGQADETELDSIGGARVGGRTAESDPGRLEFLALAGAIDTLEAYRELLG
jgi:hypothetical protein